MPKRVYDFIDANGHNVVEDWLAVLDPVLEARMRATIEVLLTAESDLPPKMLTDTREPQIKELRVNSKEALRLLLCKGPAPLRKNEEITLLFGAVERDRKYVPKKALDHAEFNRKVVLSDPFRYRKLRERESANPKKD